MWLNKFDRRKKNGDSGKKTIKKKTVAAVGCLFELKDITITGGIDDDGWTKTCRNASDGCVKQTFHYLGSVYDETSEQQQKSGV